MAVMSKPTLLTMPAEVRLRIYDCVLEPLVIRTMPEYYYMFADEWRGLMLRDYHSLVVSCKLINGEVQQHFEQYYLPNTTLFFDDVVKFGRFVVAALSSPHADLLWDVSLSLRVWGCPNLRVESDVRNLAKDLSSIAASDGIHDFYRIAIKGKEKLIGGGDTASPKHSELRTKVKNVNLEHMLAIKDGDPILYVRRSTANVQSKPELLTLPAELRLRIYDFVLEPLTAMPEHYDTYLMVDEWPEFGLKGYHSLLLCCKTISNEIQPHFEQKHVDDCTIFLEEDAYKFERFVLAAQTSPKAGLLREMHVAFRRQLINDGQMSVLQMGYIHEGCLDAFRSMLLDEFPYLLIERRLWERTWSMRGTTPVNTHRFGDVGEEGSQFVTRMLQPVSEKSNPLKFVVRDLPYTEVCAALEGKRGPQAQQAARQGLLSADILDDMMYVDFKAKIKNITLTDRTGLLDLGKHPTTNIQAEDRLAKQQCFLEDGGSVEIAWDFSYDEASDGRNIVVKRFVNGEWEVCSSSESESESETESGTEAENEDESVDWSY